jgi:hypothetical protein
MLREDLEPNDRAKDLFNQLLGRINFEVFVDNDHEEIVFKVAETFDRDRDQRIFSILTGYDGEVTLKLNADKLHREKI